MAARKVDDEAALRDVIRGAGLRATTSRIAVLRMLRGTKSPLTHGEVTESLAGRGWDRATLYRNLLDLTRVGLSRRTDLGDHVWRFEAIVEHHDEKKHPHFVCDECGTVECLDDLTIALPKNAEVPRALRARAVEVQLKGRCDRCF